MAKRTWYGPICCFMYGTGYKKILLAIFIYNNPGQNPSIAKYCRKEMLFIYQYH